MLTRVHVRNYRSLADVDVALEPMTVLIGANASGKTNFLAALLLVQAGLAGDLGEALAAQGGRSNLGWRATDQSRVEVEIDFRSADERDYEYSFSFHFDQGHQPLIITEALHVIGVDDVQTPLRREGPEVEVYDESAQELHRLRGEPSKLASASLADFEDFRHLRVLRDAVFGWRFLEPDPRPARLQQPPLASEELWPNAANLGPVIHSISSRRPEALVAVNDALSTLIPGEPRVEATLISGFVTLVFRQPAFPDRLMTTLEVSDGTLRLLAYLVALETSPTPTLLCLEEPELGLHPEAVTGLVRVLSAAAQHQGIQVVMSTHSPDVLDAIPGPSNVRVVEKNAAGETWIGPIRELSEPQEWLDRFSLGELWRINAIGANP